MIGAGCGPSAWGPASQGGATWRFPPRGWGGGGRCRVGAGRDGGGAAGGGGGCGVGRGREGVHCSAGGGRPGASRRASLPLPPRPRPRVPPPPRPRPAPRVLSTGLAPPPPPPRPPALPPAPPARPRARRPRRGASHPPPPPALPPAMDETQALDPPDDAPDDAPDAPPAPDVAQVRPSSQPLSLPPQLGAVPRLRRGIPAPCAPGRPATELVPLGCVRSRAQDVIWCGQVGALRVQYDGHEDTVPLFSGAAMRSFARTHVPRRTCFGWAASLGSWKPLITIVVFKIGYVAVFNGRTPAGANVIGRQSTQGHKDRERAELWKAEYGAGGTHVAGKPSEGVPYRFVS